MATAKVCVLSSYSILTIYILVQGLNKIQLVDLHPTTKNKVIGCVNNLPQSTSILETLIVCGVLTIRQTILYLTQLACIKILHDDSVDKDQGAPDKQLVLILNLIGCFKILIQI